MSKDDHERLQALFEKARGLEGKERERFLTEACAGFPPSLREELEAMLAVEPPDQGPLVGAWTDAGDSEQRTRSLESSAGTPSVEAADMIDSIEPEPDHIGRYRIERMLGKGAFGRVFLAHDDRLDRRVAIKVPHARLSAVQAKTYSREAGAVAGLDHPNIVPVYDIGSSDDYPYYIVYKYIDGNDLEVLLRAGSLPYHRSARIVAAVAGAIHHAHQRGLVHRDIKPRNVLVDNEGNAYVVDFGLAFKDEEYRRGGCWFGTPDYMSPEQASGRSDRVDGRSDIFSLGAVFYRLLTGRQPFRGETLSDLLSRVASADVRPPRQWDDRIPRELERICLKSLARQKSERYQTAKDLRDDLLAAATYQPQPVDVSSVTIPKDLHSLVERLARNTHDVWARYRISEGWEVGDTRDDALKTHPDLVPYEYLPESEKDVDRETVKTLLKSIIALGYTISETRRD